MIFCLHHLHITCIYKNIIVIKKVTINKFMINIVNLIMRANETHTKTVLVVVILSNFTSEIITLNF